MALSYEAFLSNPEALELRGICLGGMDAFGEIVFVGRTEDAVGRVLEANAALQQRGITKNMNCIPDTEPDWAEQRMAMISDPLRVAQYVGGQLVNYWGREGVSLLLTPAHVAEHDISEHILDPNEQHKLYMLDPATASQQSIKFVANVAFFGFMECLLGR